jgi:hypothetical protein
MAGTALAVPACSLDTIEIWPRATRRGQPLDTHARDRAHSLEATLFRLKPGGKSALWPAREPIPKGGMLPQIIPSPDHDIGSG